jgi:hypothetical protein
VVTLSLRDVIQFPVFSRPYQQLRSPSKIPALSNLRSFTVRYQRIQRGRDATRLCVWIRRAIARSPLAHLRLLCEPTADGSPARSGANVNFDGLVTHLASKHSQTLRSLDMSPAFIGSDVFQLLCVRCVTLDELSVSVGVRSLVRSEFCHCAESFTAGHLSPFVVDIQDSGFKHEVPSHRQIRCAQHQAQ